LYCGDKSLNHFKLLLSLLDLKNSLSFSSSSVKGLLINISSINGEKGQFGQTNYSAAKAGIHGFTKALAQETARKGVTVNTISPGYIATSMIMEVPENVREGIRESIPVGRFGEPSEIGRIVSFLADEQSGFITGANISANGGQYMH